jgi:hypothetical protein
VNLELAENLSLPVAQAGTQTYGAISRKGGGKTYLASKLVELLFRAGVPCIVLDPVGTWFGLRLGADGTSPGLSIPVIGGFHADVMVSPSEGERLATWLIGNNASAVIDVSTFRKNERKQFVAAFAEALFHAAKGKRRPRMVVLEEAQIFAPQQSQGQERMLGAIEDIVRLGRNYGIGSMLVSQRPQSVNKEVLNQVECLFVGQLSGAHERQAISNWVSAKGDKGKEDFLAKLPSLATGDFYAWSPQWLRCLELIRVLPKTTFDASSTPTLDEAEAVPAELPEVDLEGLRSMLAGGEEPQAASKKTNGTSDHTAELAAALARVEELEKDLLAAHAAQRARAVIIDELVYDLTRILSSLKTLTTASSVTELVAIPAPQSFTGKVPIVLPPAPRPAPAPRAAVKVEGLGKCETSILAALAHRGPMDKVRLALLCGYKHSAGHFGNTLGSMRSAGLIQACWPTDLTPEGRKRAKGLPPPMSGDALIAFWSHKLGAVGRGVLGLLPRNGSEIDRARLAEKAGYKDGTGHWGNGLGALRSHGLVEGSSRLAFGAAIRGDL